MSIILEKGRTKQLLGALMIWLLSTVMLTLFADLLIARLKLGSQWISVAAAAIVLISSCAASFYLFGRSKGMRALMPALLLWVVIASTLLMLGFLIDSDAVCLSGSIRILACSLIGSLSGLLNKRTEKRRRKTSKFAKAK